MVTHVINNGHFFIKSNGLADVMMNFGFQGTASFIVILPKTNNLDSKSCPISIRFFGEF